MRTFLPTICPQWRKNCMENCGQVLTFSHAKQHIMHYLSHKRLTFDHQKADGIQEVSGSIPLISTKNLRNLRISEVFLISRHKNVAFYPIPRNCLTLIWPLIGLYDVLRHFCSENLRLFSIYTNFLEKAIYHSYFRGEYNAKNSTTHRDWARIIAVNPVV